MSDTLAFDKSFQHLIVAYLWRDDAALNRHKEHLKASWFESPFDGQIVTILMEFYEEYNKVPSREVIDEEIRSSYSKQTDDDAKKRAAFKQRLDDMALMNVDQAEYLDKKIREFAKWSAVKSALTDTVNEFSQNQYSPEMITRFEDALKVGQEDFDPGTPWGRTYEHRIFEFEHESEKPRIPTGLPHFDNLLGGGLRAGELGILMAVPKGFKSGTMLNFAFNALFGSKKNVLYITLELSEELVGLRFDIRAAGMPKHKIYEDKDAFVSALESTLQWNNGEKNIFIKYFPPRSCTARTIDDYLKEMRERYGIVFELLIVDYLDLMKNERKRQRDDIEATEVAEAVRDLGKRWNMPVWSAVRATREATERKTLNMSHMGKSFERVGVADYIAAICQTKDERDEGKLRLTPVAFRNESSNDQALCQVAYERMLLTSEELIPIEYEDDKKSRSWKGNDSNSKSAQEDQIKEFQALSSKVQDFKKRKSDHEQKETK